MITCPPAHLSPLLTQYLNFRRKVGLLKRDRRLRYSISPSSLARRYPHPLLVYNEEPNEVFDLIEQFPLPVSQRHRRIYVLIEIDLSKEVL
jgi:hypothetical protein